MNNRRLSARDYKGVRRDGVAWQRWREYGLGFGAGLVVALVVYVSDHRASDAGAERAPLPRHALSASGGAPLAGATTAGGVSASGVPVAGGDSEGSYAFYEMLPKFEVVVPEKKEHGVRVDAAARVDRPGTYFLQAGSYHNEADAERVRAQLARQDINANVQRVALDTEVWFRIRVGPIKDLAQLNSLRQQLQAADIDSLVIRVED